MASKYGPLKCGEIREDGKIFWCYLKSREGREYWVTPEKFAELRAKMKRYDATPKSKRQKAARMREYMPGYRRLRRTSRPNYWLMHGARRRAKESGLKFTILESDIVIPSTCPVLGIPIFRSDKAYSDNSPSLDRLKPELGYVRGNVFVISNRANRLKNNGAPEEHRAIADWMERNGYGSH